MSKPGMTMGPGSIRIADDFQQRIVNVKCDTGEDLPDETARYFADEYLKRKNKLDGFGGKWCFWGTERINYDEVKVIYCE